jgi:hypothetical protein
MTLPSVRIASLITIRSFAATAEMLWRNGTARRGTIAGESGPETLPNLQRRS